MVNVSSSIRKSYRSKPCQAVFSPWKPAGACSVRCAGGSAPKVGPTNPKEQIANDVQKMSIVLALVRELIPCTIGFFQLIVFILIELFGRFTKSQGRPRVF